MDGGDIGPVLLKLRFLASRLGSGTLEEWVRHEAEGYPANADLPDYRKIGVSYQGDFSGPFGSGIRNAPIPPYLVEKFGGDQWVNYQVRQSIAGIEALVASTEDGRLMINAANLIMLLQGNVYPDYACNSIKGTISQASLIEIQSAVRNRVLELTIHIERSVPEALEIGLGAAALQGTKGAEAVTSITNQIIHGNFTSISNSGAGASFNLSIVQGNSKDVERALTDGGIAGSDAAEFAQIIAEERPGEDGQPFGAKAKNWVAGNISKALNGTWKAGLDVATQLLTSAAKQYYGLE